MTNHDNGNKLDLPKQSQPKPKPTTLREALQSLDNTCVRVRELSENSNALLYTLSMDDEYNMNKLPNIQTEELTKQNLIDMFNTLNDELDDQMEIIDSNIKKTMKLIG
jgi:hypothetical protein